MRTTIRHFVALLALAYLSGLSLTTLAHGGGLDAKGCHNDRKRGEYHCHRSPTSNGAAETVRVNQPTRAANDGATTTLSLRKGKITSFRQAKSILRTQVYKEPARHVAFYSGCRYNPKGKKLIPDWATCGFKPRKNENRASRIEWEHIVPAWHIGHQRQCWQAGGRRNCSRNDDYFKMAEADMHNLVPAIGEINGDRSNFRYSELGGDFFQYGAVQMRIDFKQRAVQPPASAKGNIARTYFYMVDTYQLQLAKAQKKLFEAWNKMDPVDSWECLRNQRIATIQGNDNPYVTRVCQLAGL